jgi:hypothetical protein
MRLSHPIKFDGRLIEEISFRRVTLLDWTSIQNLPCPLNGITLFSRLSGLPKEAIWRLTDEDIDALCDELHPPDEMSDFEVAEWRKRLPIP